MKVGQLRELLADVRDDAEVFCEVISMWSAYQQFRVADILYVGDRTDDPGFVLKLIRTR